MGLIFIAAGNSTKNRYKTLDKPHSVTEICSFLDPEVADRLKSEFSDNESVFVWGANEKSFSDISQVMANDYVVDVKNKKVIQVFKFSFFIKTQDTKLQEYLRWDQEKPLSERRPYLYVYFLKTPGRTRRSDKGYFQSAFDLEDNSQWLAGQKYFDDSEVELAIQRTSSSSLEHFLGISKDPNNATTYKVIKPILQPKATSAISHRPLLIKEESSKYHPVWLRGLIGKVKALRSDSGHLERDHEDLVASLFELLGYERIHDIKFRRGNIDIRIDKDGKPQITIEVKADWNLSSKSRGALQQAYNYAHETGTRFVITTNGDRYCVYDRKKGLTYEEHLIADFELTNLSTVSSEILNKLKKGSLL